MTTVSNLPWTVATVATSPTIQSTLTFNLLALSRARLILVGSMSTPTISLAPKSPAPIASLPVPEPRSRTFRPVMSRCSKLAMKSSSAPTSGETGYCSLPLVLQLFLYLHSYLRVGLSWFGGDDNSEAFCIHSFFHHCISLSQYPSPIFVKYSYDAIVRVSVNSGLFDGE